ILAMVVLSAFIAAGEVALFGFLGSIVDWLSNAERAGFLEREGMQLWLMGGFLLLALPLAMLLHSLIVHQTLLGNYPMIARWQMHRYLLKQSMTFFADEFAGRVATRVMQTSLAVREVVMTVADVLVYIVVYFVSVVVMVAQSDPRLALPLLSWLVIYVAVVSYFVPKLARVSREQADARSMMTGRIVDSYTNINTVKLFSHAGREAGYAKSGMQRFLQTVHRQMRFVTTLEFCVYFNNVLVVFLIAGLSIWLWLESVVSVGSIAVAVALALRLNGMSQWIMWEVSGLFESIGVVHDGMSMMSKRHAVTDRPTATKLVVPKGGIRFEDVTFHYGKESGVIAGLNLDVQPGERLGLVGRSGAGKTTIANILLRFYDLESGRILIDGVDIASVTQDSLRSQIGVVTQDTSLLHRSIRDNIAYSKPGATDDEVIEAAKRAKAWEFIEELEDQSGRKGFDAFVGERGVRLSGGQRQRIAIARVFLKDAPILVLDEATSALDSEVEAAIQENLFDLMSGKTVIAIAHRLSTIASLDRLVVVEKGRIIETGTHTELVEANGVYADLWSHQSGGFLGDGGDNQDSG
ncbi:MAG: ABC transporter ATP-binding protein/permease, partial [Gammaproteobacteria bacterium]|nr:ABC transporter ATP-binding protein/permease [Gammaproteobacteria bacterium]